MWVLFCILGYIFIQFQSVHRLHVFVIRINTMEWQLRNNSVYFVHGTVYGNKVAAFDFDQTLAWSDSGLTFMRTVQDWVPTTDPTSLLNLIIDLVSNNWTFVILTNQLERDPKFTQTALARIRSFIEKLVEMPELRRLARPFHPFVYVSIREDNYRKPRRGMWDMFLEDTGLIPSEASFYCGDAQGPDATNPLYRWGNYDVQFAQACGLAYYNPEEILGVFSIPLPRTQVILVMAAHPVQYNDHITNLLAEDPSYIQTSLTEAEAALNQGRNVIITGERLATLAGRRRVMHLLPERYRRNTVIYMFTRPIAPFLTPQEAKAADLTIRGYANALDMHPGFKTHITAIATTRTAGEPFRIVRVN